MPTPDLDQIKKLEAELQTLKLQLEEGEISPNKFTEKRLFFDDETTGQRWLLDNGSATWYVGTIGSDDWNTFELAIPQPGELLEEPLPPPITSEDPSQNPPESPSASPMSSSESTSDGLEAKSDNWFTRSRWPIVAGGGVLVVLIVIGIFLLADRSGDSPPQNSMATLLTATVTEFALVVSTPTTLPATATATPTMIPAEPTFTGTPTPVPTDTSSPTFTPLPPLPTVMPTDTPTLTPSPTDTPAVLVTPSPVPVTIEAEQETVLSGRLAYPFYDTEAKTFVIHIIDVNTEEILYTQTHASQPALTLDGTRLAYHSWQDPIGLFEISWASDGPPGYINPHQEAHRPQWAPNGIDKVYTWLQENTKNIEFSKNNGIGNVLDVYALQSATWTYDDRLIVNACQGSRCGLAQVGTNGTGFILIESTGPDALAPAVSPTGQIAYMTKLGDNWDVYLLDSLGASPQRLTTQAGKDGLPTWSPDGAYLAYLSQQGRNWVIRIISSDNQTEIKTINLPGPLEGPIQDFPADAQRGWTVESISWSN